MKYFMIKSEISPQTFERSVSSLYCYFESCVTIRSWGLLIQVNSKGWAFEGFGHSGFDHSTLSVFYRLWPCEKSPLYNLIPTDAFCHPPHPRHTHSRLKFLWSHEPPVFSSLDSSYWALGQSKKKREWYRYHSTL